jgi:glucoamylase
MPRDIPIGNGSLLVNFDRFYQLRDFYWPHVGLENHTGGHPFRFGVWADGVFRWIDHASWTRSLDYESHTLVTRALLSNPDLALRLVCRDTVDFHENLYLRCIDVHNDTDQPRHVRLFFHQDFHIGGYPVGDSAYYEPERGAVFHYKDRWWFVINTAKANGQGGWECHVDAWAIGTKETQGREGTWRDAEDGQLSGNATAQGSVDSTVGLYLTVPPHDSATGWYWIGVGEEFREVTRINRSVRDKQPPEIMERTRNYWALWGSRDHVEFADLPDEVCRLYRRSLLIVRTQIDNGGAIIAANDFDMARSFNDTYSYMWPRDGALVAAALIDESYNEMPRLFFDFCHRVITEEGYFLHKYNADGSLASSWHGWYYEGQKELPVQEDETALVLWALWRHFEHFRDVEFIKPLYRGLVNRAANWLVAYTDLSRGLPLPSWDLWEERRGVCAWTVGATWGGLQAAAHFAHAFGERPLGKHYAAAAARLREAVEAHLWQPDVNRFARMLVQYPDRPPVIDKTVDASLSGLWYFGMFAPDHPKILATMQAIQDRLTVHTAVGGVARYENDNYYRVSQDVANVPGNPWFICTLWLAQWRIALAHSRADLAPARDILVWAARHALPSGVMAEQVDPYTGEGVSVSPLTWSQATLISTVHEYLERWKLLA